MDESTGREAESPSGGMIVPILMSARSGSSVVAHAVQVLGVDFGDRLRSPKSKNPLGFFEDRDVLQLSRRLRDELGCRARMCLVEAARWDSPGIRRLEDEAVALLQRRFGKAQLWGFKNGRILRFLPFWQRVLARLRGEPRYVFAIRNPLAAAASRERTRSAEVKPYGGGVELNYFEWFSEVVPYFDQLRDTPLLVVDYDRLVADPLPQLARIAGFLGLPWVPGREASAGRFAGSFLSEGLRHHRYGLDELLGDPRVPGLTRDAYQWLDALAGDRMTQADPALWEDWSRLQGRLAELAPLLNFAGTTELALWHAQLNPLSPLEVLGRRFRRSTPA